MAHFPVIQNPTSLNNKYDILTIHNVLITYTLVFMHKVRHFPLELPRSVRKTIAVNAPVPGSTQDSCYDFFTKVH